MDLKTLGEFGFINRIQKQCLVSPDNVSLAIGDDAAAFSLPSGEETLVTADLLMEGVHFIKASVSGFDLGHKALAVNLSDIAAMGGTAKAAFISLAVPNNCELAYLEDFYKGMTALARRFDVNILGGDTTRSLSGLVINIAVIGSAAEEEMLRRDRAVPGDKIFVTGYLGESRAGLYLLLNHIKPDSEVLRHLWNAHIRPLPCLEEGRFFAGRSGVHAAIDISDGLASDIGHIIRKSGAGARIHSERLPVSEPLKIFCSQFDFDPAEYALAGGEDYQLLVTVSRTESDALISAYERKFGKPLYCIGEINDSDRLEVVLPDGQVRCLEPLGWDHFKSDSI